MARQARDPNVLFDSPFATNMRLLLKEHKETQEYVGKSIGKSRPTVQQYCDGSSEAPYETLVKIAQHFNVTVDWLLGMPNASREINADKHQVMKTTGLSEEAVDELLHVSSLYLAAIDYMLCMSNFSNALKDLDTAIRLSTNFRMRGDRFDLVLKKSDSASKDDFQRKQDSLPRNGIRADELVNYYISHCFDMLKSHAEIDIRESNYERIRQTIRRSISNGNDHGTEE